METQKKEKIKAQSENQKNATEKAHRELSLGFALKKLRRAAYQAVDRYKGENKMSDAQALAALNEFLARVMSSRTEDEALEREVQALRAKFGDKLIIKTRC